MDVFQLIYLNKIFLNIFDHEMYVELVNEDHDKESSKINSIDNKKKS